MDATYFVLLCAAFVLVAIWLRTSAPEISDACRFESHGKAVNRSAPMPPDILILPEDHMGATGSQRLTLPKTGALTAGDCAGGTCDTEVLASAIGRDQQIVATPRGQD